MKKFTPQEVEELSTLERPLMIIDGMVYDLTEFVDSHPGGDILLEYHGKDASKVFKDAAIHEHSDAAYMILGEYLVGKSISSSDQVLSELTVTEELMDTKKDDFIDLHKPIFYQLWMKDISIKEYVKQIHTPRHLKEPARFFAHPVLEFFSRTPWYAIPIVWLPIITMFFLKSVELSGLATAVMLFLLGVVVWTLLEYVLHRFLFHVDEMLPDSKIAMMMHFTLHGVHHFLPMDKLRLVFPPVMAVVLASMIYGLFSVILPGDTCVGVFAGGVFGYVLYDLTHYYLHHGVAVGYLKEMKTYHIDHHYKNFNEGYGITSKLWDYVFFTVPSSRKLFAD